LPYKPSIYRIQCVDFGPAGTHNVYFILDILHIKISRHVGDQFINGL